LLRGEIPLTEGKEVEGDIDELLASASLRITSSAILSNGGRQEPRTYTVPLHTTVFVDAAHLAIRNATGSHVENLVSGERNDILIDYWIPGMFYGRVCGHSRLRRG
jgi:hypothetical protein